MIFQKILIRKDPTLGCWWSYSVFSLFAVCSVQSVWQISDLSGKLFYALLKTLRTVSENFFYDGEIIEIWCVAGIRHFEVEIQNWLCLLLSTSSICVPKFTTFPRKVFLDFQRTHAQTKEAANNNHHRLSV